MLSISRIAIDLAFLLRDECIQRYQIEAVMLWVVSSQQRSSGRQQKARAAIQTETDLVKSHHQADQAFMKVVTLSEPQLLQWLNARTVFASIEMIDKLKIGFGIERHTTSWLFAVYVDHTRAIAGSIRDREHNFRQRLQTALDFIGIALLADHMNVWTGIDRKIAI